MPDARFDEIVSLAEALGFGLCGVARAAPASRPEHARQWIASGQHGQMHYLAEHLETRLDPQRLLPGAQSVIAVADAYRMPGAEGAGSGQQVTQQPPEPGNSTAAARPAHGRVARYAWGRDYHKVIKKRLHRLSDALAEQHPGAAFRATVDTAPAFEREHAARAGLGWTGKHTLLIHPRHGSYFLLGLILTTLDLETAEQTDFPSPLIPGATVPGADHCANCTRCIDACPTGAIAPAGYTLDARRCISYLTLEHRTTIDPALHAPLGEWIAGCDICQQVCPYNEIAQRHPLPVLDDYTPRSHAPSLELTDVLRWTEDDRLRVLAGTALMRMKLPMLKRNALIAAGNALREQPDAALLAAVRACADDPEPLVRETAREVLAALPT